MGSDDTKWRNIAKRRPYDIIAPEAIAEFLERRGMTLLGILHMGAISMTTEVDVDAIVRTNVRLSIDLWSYCARENIPFVYASSAATYGDGRQGFEDRSDDDYLSRLRPLNAYGWSKHMFDRWVSRAVETGRPTPPRWAGLKFFNVYGPNEYHKGGQRSVAAQFHTQIREDGCVRLFRSGIPTIRTADRCAISSGSAIASTRRLGRSGIPHRSPACTTWVQVRHAPFLIRRK